MANFQQFTRVIPLEGVDLRCPVCNSTVVINATVTVKDAATKITGSHGINRKTFSVFLKTDVVEIEFNHKCQVDEKE